MIFIIIIIYTNKNKSQKNNTEVISKTPVPLVQSQLSEKLNENIQGFQKWKFKGQGHMGESDLFKWKFIFL